MAIDYKKELEIAAKNMILVHEPDVLIRMIVRMLVQKIKVNHAGILLHQPERDTYVLTVSRGPTGVKIPAGFARVDPDNALIRFFRDGASKTILPQNALIYELGQKLLRKRLDGPVKELLQKSLYQMEIFEAEVAVPTYYRDELIGIVFLGKKKNRKRFAAAEIDFFLALASDVAMAIRNARLFKELEAELNKKYRLFIHTTVALAAAIDAKDHYTHGHTSRVTTLSLAIAKKLGEKDKKISDPKFLEHLHISGLLHDIGKIGIPESILNKPAPLNEEERKKMNEHPLVGTAILQPIKELEDSILGVKYHHEKYDGSGYPEGLKGEQIPMIASIISVADTFDAMVTDRPYRKGFSKAEAIEEIKRVSGKQFDAKVATAFIELYEEGKI